jgi:hypothetical protein
MYNDSKRFGKISKHLPIDIFYDKSPEYVTVSHRWSNKFAESVNKIVKMDYHCNQPTPCGLCYICTIQNVINDSERLCMYQHLFYLSVSKGHEYVWIDAICINQSDREDKIQQINRMAEYYKNGVVTYCFIRGLFSLLEANFPVVDWSERGWIVQEMFLSKSKRIVVRGGTKMEQLVDKMSTVFEAFATNMESQNDPFNVNVQDIIDAYEENDRQSSMTDVGFDFYMFTSAQINNTRIKDEKFRSLSKSDETLDYYNGPARKCLLTIGDFNGLTDKAANIGRTLSFCAAISMISDKKFTYQRDRLLSIVSLVDEDIKKLILKGFEYNVSSQEIYMSVIVHEFQYEDRKRKHLLHSFSYGGFSNIYGIDWAQPLEGAVRGASNLILHMRHEEEVQYVECNMTLQGIKMFGTNGSILLNKDVNIYSERNFQVIMDVIQEGAGHRFLALNLNNGEIHLLSRNIKFDDLSPHQVIIMVLRLAAASRIYWESDDSIENRCKEAASTIPDILKRIEYLFLHDGSVVTVGNTDMCGFGMLVVLANDVRHKIGTIVFKKEILQPNYSVYKIV